MDKFEDSTEIESGNFLDQLIGHPFLLEDRSAALYSL
jgi:hypothetical protein